MRSFAPSARSLASSVPAAAVVTNSRRFTGVKYHNAGVAVGPALLYTSSNLTLSTVERHSISDEQVVPEQERLRNALAITAQELHSLATNLQKNIGSADAAIFDAQALMLDDPQLQKAVDFLKTRGQQGGKSVKAG